MENLTIALPKNLENMALPDPEMVNFYKDLEERIVWVDGDIDEYTLEITKLITQWNRQDRKKKISPNKRKPIKLIFFSFGGDLDVHNTLIDVIKLSKTPVWGINAGRCASAAAFIFLSCHKRYMLKRGTFLFHQGSAVTGGTFAEICAWLEDYQEAISEITKFMIEHTNYTAEEVAENIVGEWYIRADEAVEKGVCDEVVSSIDVLL